MKILIVDDNQELASLLHVMLEEEGFEVKSAKDGREGYCVYLQFKPDWVITDLQMPGENGLELVGHIRKHNPEVRAIYMSGDPSRFRLPLEEEKRRYHASFLEKPFSKVELMGLLVQF